MEITIGNAQPEEKETLEQLAKQFVESREEPLFSTFETVRTEHYPAHYIPDYPKICLCRITEIIDDWFEHRLCDAYVIRLDGTIIGGAFFEREYGDCDGKMAPQINFAFVHSDNS